MQQPRPHYKLGSWPLYWWLWSSFLLVYEMGCDINLAAEMVEYVFLKKKTIVSNHTR